MVYEEDVHSSDSSHLHFDGHTGLHNMMTGDIYQVATNIFNSCQKQNSFGLTQKSARSKEMEESMPEMKIWVCNNYITPIKSS